MPTPTVCAVPSIPRASNGMGKDPAGKGFVGETANGLQSIIRGPEECIFVSGAMLPQRAGQFPAEWRIVALFSIAALGILGLLMIDVWALDPMVYCPGAFPSSRSCSARLLWFLLALLWAGAAVGVAGLCLVQFGGGGPVARPSCLRPLLS